MPLFFVTWRIYDDEDHKNDHGALKSYGRWHNLGNGTGATVLEASTAEDLYNGAWNWSESMCNIDVAPIIDHNKLREVILGSPPEWVFSYENSNAEPNPGEVLYLASYEFYDDCRVKGYEFCCSMTYEADQEANGKGAIRHLGRWHLPNEGKGHIICAAKDSNDLFAWANKWASMVKISFQPVLTDKAVAKLIKEKAGYEKKLADLMAKMSMA